MMYRFFCFLLFWSTLFLQDSIDGVVAVVGEQSILRSTVIQNAKMLALQSGVDFAHNPEEFSFVLDQSLEVLINQNVVFCEAEKDTLIVISESEVSSALDRYVEGLVSELGSEERLEAEVGKSLRQFRNETREDVYKNLLFEKYQQNFVQNIGVTRSEVENFYIDFQDSIPPNPSSTNYSLIEIPVEPGVKAKNSTISFLSDLVDSLRSGANFADFARLYSDDLGSAQSGGELGYIRRGLLVKEFEEVAFGLGIDEISEPFKSPFGYHIVQLIERHGEKINVRHILRNIRPTEEDRQIALDEIRKIYHFIKEKPSSFDSLATLYSLKYENLSRIYGWTIDNNIHPVVLDNLHVLSPSTLSYPFELDNGSFVLAYVYDRKKSSKPTLENSWGFIENLTLQHKIQSSFNDKINELKLGIYIKVF